MWIMYLSTQLMQIGGVPPDGTPFNKVNTFHDALVSCYYILAGLGILYSTVCLVFNFTQRNKRYIVNFSPSGTLLKTCIIYFLL